MGNGGRQVEESIETDQSESACEAASSAVEIYNKEWALATEGDLKIFYSFHSYFLGSVQSSLDISQVVQRLSSVQLAITFKKGGSYTLLPSSDSVSIRKIDGLPSTFSIVSRINDYCCHRKQHRLLIIVLRSSSFISISCMYSLAVTCFFLSIFCPPFPITR